MIDKELSRRILIYAGISGGIGVAIGAFGAHFLESFVRPLEYAPEVLQRRIAQFDTGVRYHLIHSVALLALASLPIGPTRLRQWVCRLFMLGVLLFSGSLYVLVLTNQTKLGMVTPLGGLCWIAGWLLLVVLAMRKDGSSEMGKLNR